MNTKNKYLVVLFLLNSFLAIFLGLADDEAYYWTYSNSFSFGHYDHPPMVGWFIAIGEFVFGKSELGVRFAFNVASIICFYLIKKISNIDYKSIFILYISMPLLFAQGILALPDIPLLMYFLLFLVSLKKYLQSDNSICLLSLSIAGMFYSKYLGLLPVIAVLMFKPDLLKRKTFYKVFILSFLMFVPHLWWQYTHDFVSFKFHLFGRPGKGFQIENIINLIAVLFLGSGFGIYCLKGKYFKSQNDFDSFLLKCSFFFAGLFFIVSFTNKVQANWLSLVSILLVIILGKSIDVVKKWLLPTQIINSLLLILLLLPAHMYKSLSFAFRVHEFKDWDDKASKIDEVIGDRDVVFNNYQIAAKYMFYSQFNKNVYVTSYFERKSNFDNSSYDVKNLNNNREFIFISKKKYNIFNIYNELKFLNYPKSIYTYIGLKKDDLIE